MRAQKLGNLFPLSNYLRMRFDTSIRLFQGALQPSTLLLSVRAVEPPRRHYRRNLWGFSASKMITKRTARKLY